MRDFYVDGKKLDLDKTVSYYLDLNPEIKDKAFKHLPMLKMALNMKLSSLVILANDDDMVQKELNKYVQMVKDHNLEINTGE